MRARSDSEYAARCLLALFHRGNADEAETGALLIAEALRTLRTYDARDFTRTW